MIWLAIVLGLYAAFLLIFWLVQDSLVFPRGMAGAPSSARPPAGAEQVWIEGDGARVEGWYFPPRDEGGTVVLFAHGNAMLIDDSLEFARMYREMGVGVLLVEFRGYGASGGRPSQRAIVEDFVRFREWLDTRAEVGEVVYHGRSLGGAVVALLAREREPAAMILESTFTSVRSFTSKYLIPSFLVRHPFDTAGAIGQIHVPILILHGESDEIVPIRHGRRLHELAPRSEFVAQPGGHNDFPVDIAAYEGAIREFLVERGLLD